MNILIVYASKEGQTEKIAGFIADVVRRHGHQVMVIAGNHPPEDFATADFDAAIIGGSIHMSDYPDYLKNFVTAHKDWLNQVPSALFTVCMAIHSKHEQEQKAARAFGPALAEETHWQPAMMETFAGAIKYTQYGFITRLIMRHIAKKEGGDTDTSRDHEYTDWDAVTRFSEQFLNEIEN
jgi:menaquinone-dependent protoporphyrinogen oxidase